MVLWVDIVVLVVYGGWVVNGEEDVENFVIWDYGWVEFYCYDFSVISVVVVYGMVIWVIDMVVGVVGYYVVYVLYLLEYSF